MGFLNARPALAISGVFVGSFVVSFALMWRARDPAEVTADPPPPTSAGEPRTVPPPIPQTNAAEWTAPVSARPPPPPPTGAETAEETVPAVPMPLGINVYNRRNRHRYEGYVANTSNKPLSVTLEVVGADGRVNSSLRLELPAGGRQDFSSDSGFDMHSSDQIVVHSDPYQDVTVQVP